MNTFKKDGREYVKIIFLDIDGVTNTINHIEWRFSRPKDKRGTQEDWCAQACVNINNLADKVDGDVAIVMSSSWRLGRPIMELRRLLEENGIEVPLIDKTPWGEPGCCRGDEIQEWLESRRRVHAIENYVILDDDDDFLPKQEDHVVQCDSDDGFANFDKLKQAIKILSQ